MSHRDVLRAQLKIDEGCVEHAYPDSNGYLTIGVGRLIDKRKGGKLRQDEIALMLENDIVESEASARVLFPNFDSLSENRRAVLCNMAFNLGRSELAGFKRLRKALEAEDYETASAEMLHSAWALQVGIRAQRLSKMMKEG